MRGLATIIAATAGLVSGPAFAWEPLNNPSKDNQCGFVQTYDGPGDTTVIVAQNQSQFDRDDKVGVLIYNENWSLKDGDEIADKIVLASKDYEISQPAPIAITHGFGLAISFDHLDKFAGSVPGAVIVKKGDEVIDRLDFSGFYVAWLDFRSCHSRKVDAKRERERQESIARDIPRDPFAK